jgi:hypothetical protein
LPPNFPQKNANFCLGDVAFNLEWLRRVYPIVSTEKEPKPYQKISGEKSEVDEI